MIYHSSPKLMDMEGLSTCTHVLGNHSTDLDAKWGLKVVNGASLYIQSIKV